MHRSLIAFALATITLHSTAQVIASPLANLSVDVRQQLQGTYVDIDTLVGYLYDPNQIAFFHDSTASIGLDSGIVMTTGHYLCVNGPNNMPNASFGGGMLGAYDQDLSSMATLYASAIGDPSILHLDLVPWGDTLCVRYVFGSEEYDEYVCSDKDDRMGMFLSGPGIAGQFMSGAINMATLPATGLPVTVNTLNRGLAGSQGGVGMCYMNQFWLQDTIYYINNDNGLGTQMDAYSVVLTAKAAVQPGATYHLKIAIADATDVNFDSAVFLEHGGIYCTALSTTIDPPAASVSLALWCDRTDLTVNMRGFSNANAPVRVETFDAAGRLLQRSIAQRNGSSWSVPLAPTAAGLVIVRALQGERVVTGRVFVR